jgi:colicin import membrane protein
LSAAERVRKAGLEALAQVQAAGGNPAQQARARALAEGTERRRIYEEGQGARDAAANKAEAEAKRLAAEAKREADQRKAALTTIEASNEARQFEASLIGKTAREVAGLRAVREAEAVAAGAGLKLSAAAVEGVRSRELALYDLREAAETVGQVEDARFELSRANQEQETRAAFIARTADKLA